MSIFDSKSELIASVCQELYGKIPHGNTNIDIFAHHFFKRAPIESLQKMLISELVFIASEAWKLSQTRRPDESLLKIVEYHLSHHTLPRLGIFMVNIDQPFLIDSIIAYLDRNDFKVELMVHPVLGVQRTKEGKLVSLVNLKETHPLVSADLGNELKSIDSQTLIAESTTESLKKSNQPESIAFIQIKSNLKKKQIEALREELNELITQVRNVVSAWPLTRERIHALSDHIIKLPLLKKLPPLDERQDLKEFLNWLESGYFIFLGSRYFSINPRIRAKENLKRNRQDNSVLCLENNPDSPDLGLFRNEAYTNNPDLLPVFSQTCLITDKIKSRTSGLSTLSITKTNSRSTVHRGSRIDSIEIIDWDHNGNPQGLYQFIGIFTKIAFTGSAFDIPIIGRKVGNVFNQFGLAPQWHDGKTLISILNSIPRDELLYLDEDEIYELSQNVLNMNDKHSLTLAIRPDIYGRYITVMVFIPKEKYSVSLKDRFYKILEHHLKGKMSSDNVFLGELDYARLVFVVSYPEPTLVAYNQSDIEKVLLEASLSWNDYLERLISAHYDEENTANLLARYQMAFPATYIEAFKPEQAFIDINYIEKITDTAPINLYLYKGNGPKTLKVKIFHAHHSLSLSTLLPILQNLSLQVIGETSYLLEKEGYSVWIHDFEVNHHEAENWKTNHNNLVQAFQHIWNGTAENDVLHQLILKAGLNVRQVTLVRAYLKFLRQLQLPYSIGYLEETLSYYPDITRHFVDLFELRFSLKSTKANELEKVHLLKDIHHLLGAVDRLDHDRILRLVLNAIESTVRTNYFQTSETEAHKLEGLKPYLSLKFDGRKLEDLPHPRPLYEIFIYSPRVEAIHLRGAKVARGGIRWSDRPEDFRTEILALMKAQTVKNAVIVPLGSKGGFVVKNQDKFTNHSDMMEEVVNCYQMMMRGMLDITDNIIKGEIVRPHQVTCYDEDDPYLVVAADKGTAEFSDIANAISAEYGFWLGDAFASGGSSGYDHKKIAITARGVWESVKRHFRELKLNCQTMPFTAVGVGDMSGDVFGNGMLQSPKLCLLAAFDRQYIFLDPDPDMEIGFKERKRLFEMPQSTWKNYNPKLISAGGGVFDRSVKSIKLSPQCRKAFGISHAEIRPDDLIKSLLCLPVDLLYFGGIGTFIKATTETHSDVVDRTNNDIRVNAKSVQARVIGEGANLAMTQRARIEYSLKGGRLNTDAIDNSAGVDCSDHEVNLKILFSILGSAVSRIERDNLLKEMTDEVAKLVLADNYRQTQILSVLEATKSSEINSYQSLIRILEADVGVDRSLEALPDDETLEQRQVRNLGLTRPELSVLLAYSKIALYEKILGSNLPDKAFYRPWFQGYFPKVIQERFEKAILSHPLRREITATVLANEIINRVGPAFIYEIIQTSSINEVDVVDAFFLACHVLELPKLWSKIDNLDFLMVEDVQIQVLLDIKQSLEQIVLWFLRHSDIKQTYFAGLHTLLSQVPDRLHGDQKHIFDMRNNGFMHLGIPPDIAQSLAMIPFLPALMDIMLLGKKHHNPTAIAQTYFTLRSKIGLDWLTMQASQLHLDTDWQRSARTILIDDLSQIQFKLTSRVLSEGVASDVDAWMQKNKDNIHRIHPILDNIKSAGHPDLGMLSYAMRQLERLV